MQGKWKKTGADAVAEVTPRRPANITSNLPDSALPEAWGLKPEMRWPFPGSVYPTSPRERQQFDN